MLKRDEITQYVLILAVMCGMLTIIVNSEMDNTLRYAVGGVGVIAIIVIVYRLSGLMFKKDTK